MAIYSYNTFLFSEETDPDAKNVRAYPTSYKHNDERYALTSGGKDIIDSEVYSNTSKFYDKRRQELILESEDVVKAYNEYIDFRIDKIMDFKNDFGTNVVQVARDIAKNKKNVEGLSDEEIRRYIKGNFFYNSDNPDEIKALLKMRISYCEGLCSILKKMLNLSAKLFKLEEDDLEDIEYMIDDMDEEKDPQEAVEFMKNKIADNPDQFIIKDGDTECIDLSSLGGGKIFMNSLEGDDMYGIMGAGIGGGNKKSRKLKNYRSGVDQEFQKALKYDCIILCHGGSVDASDIVDSTNEAMKDKEFKPFIEFCKKEGYKDDQIRSFIKDMIDKGEKLWSCQPVGVGGDSHRIVNCVLADAINRGYKKILVEACNPGHHAIHPTLNKTKRATIMYTKYSNLFEDYYYKDSEYDSYYIDEAEYELIEFAESFRLNYDECIYDEFETIYISEGVIDTVVTFAKKVVSIIIGLFKKLWEFFKKIISKIKSFFTGKSTNKKIDKPKEVKIITIENASISTTKISSSKELEQKANKALNNIRNEISKQQKNQIECTKKLAELTEKLSKTA